VFSCAAASAAERGSPSTLTIVLLTAFGVLGVLVGLMLLIFALIAGLSMEIVYDGRNKNLRVRDQIAFFTTPFERIASIDVPLVAEGTIDIGPSLAPRQMIRRRPQHALDIRTPHGRLRFFRGHEREKLQFVADVLTQRLPATTASNATENDNVIAVATNSYGATRYWLPRVGVAIAAILLSWAAWEGVPPGAAAPGRL
jgi:hypothetical protein